MLIVLHMGLGFRFNAIVLHMGLGFRVNVYCAAHGLKLGLVFTCNCT
jgi:hypothetical protein